MSDQGSAVIVGGTSGLGRQVAQVLAARGDEVVITGRDKAKAESVAAQIGGRTRGLALDLADRTR
jgi:short-subunit dehydrogenase